MEIYAYVYIKDELLVAYTIHYQHESAPNHVLHFCLTLM